MSNPLITTVDEGNAVDGLFTNIKSAGNGAWAGTGIFYDAKSTLDDARKGDWLALGMDAAADGLDALGLITDPFGVLLSAPVGWIIEHISFLKKPLDLLAGDPEEVRAKAGTWTNIAAALDKSAADYQRSAEALKQHFTGAAADAYVRAAGNYCGAVSGAAGHARDAAKAFEVAGAIVGTVRGAIRDAISQFCADAIIKGLAALALSFETFGASVAAWITDTVFEATSLASRLAAKITRVVAEVKQLVTGARRSISALDHAGEDLAAGARSADRAAGRSATEAADAHPTRPAEAPPEGAHTGAAHEPGGEPSAATRREEAGVAFQAARKRQRQVNENLNHALNRVDEARTGVSSAESRLANARTPRQRAAAEQDIAAAQRRLDNASKRADHWRTELGERKQQADEALDHYRDAYKNEGPIPEGAERPVDIGKELGMQGKESRADNSEHQEAGRERSETIDDGSLVGPEE